MKSVVAGLALTTTVASTSTAAMFHFFSSFNLTAISARFNTETPESLAEDVDRVPRKVGKFNSIEVSGALVVKLRQGDPAVEVEANKDVQDRIITEVSGSTLKVYRKSGDWQRHRNNDNITVYITVKDLKALSVSGASNIKTETELSGNTLAVEASGASNLTLQLRYSTLALEASGATKLVAKGSTNTLAVEATGASNLALHDLKAATAAVEASGASSIKVQATESLAAEASGASSVRYTGNPKKVAKDESGASSISPMKD